MSLYLQMDGNGSMHAQLTRALQAAILSGRLGQGEQLPATRLLAKELRLSRNTVLAAYEQLRAEGFIAARVGSGSYVLPRCDPERKPSLTVGAIAPPQSRYAQRSRKYHDPERVAGRVSSDMRHAFQYGIPMTNPALTTAWARELSRAALYTAPNYPMPQGLPALREAVCHYLGRRRGVQVAPEDILIVAGTQQALSLTARVLLDEGDTVGLEEPHYRAIRTVLLAHGADIRAIPIDGEGIICDALPQPAPKLVCTTPSHQFPTGAVMSLSRRMALLDYAERHRCWIFEDDYDGEFRYDSKPFAALRSLDEHNRVIYVGTFSKALFPALRMGYLVMPPQLRRDFIAAKWLDDFGSPAIEQAALANFVEKGGFERHLRRTAQVLRERRRVLIEGLQACSRGRLDLADSRAGMHLVLWLRGRTAGEGEQLIEHAAKRGLGLFSIAPHFLEPPDRAGFLMGYGGMPVAEIETALEIFAHCLDGVFPLSAPPARQRSARRQATRAAASGSRG